MIIEIELPTGTLKADVPQSWNDLTADQCGLCLAVFQSPTLLMKGDEAIFWQRKQVFKALSGFTDDNLNEWYGEDLKRGTTQEEWLWIFRKTIEQATDFLFDTNEEGRLSLRPALTVNLFPWLKVADTKGTIQKYYAAHSTHDDPLSNISLDEMSRIFSQYENYQATNERDSLNQLLAVLYRKPKEKTRENLNRNYDSDIRQPLETYQSGIDRRAKLFDAMMPDYHRRVIAFHIVSCRARISELYPDLFTRNGSNTEGGDWLDFILELSDYDITKNSEILKQDAHDALTTAERLVKRNKSRIKT